MKSGTQGNSMNKTNTLHNNMPDMQTDYCGTTYAAKFLGLSVGTIQMLVEKNELHAWKTQGGHRRISMTSIRAYQLKYNQDAAIKDVTKNNRLRVLLVEDDDVTREMLLGFCESDYLPIDCTAMASGMEALIDIANFKPDVLITDLGMPGIDGFELLRTLRQNPLFDRMAILALTALTAEEIQKKGGLPEGSIYKQKPVKAEWFDGFFAGIKVGAIDLQKISTDKNSG
jgi:excisionase family DNA binding protein